MEAKLLLELHLEQTKKALKNTLKLNFSDRRKEVYLTSLEKLLNAINIDEPEDAKLFLNFIFKSLEYLSDSSLNQIPYEAIHCLEHAMNDWVGKCEEDKYIIVTSLINDSKGYSFDCESMDGYGIKERIERKGVKFEYQLVKFNVPLSHVRDYMMTPIYYHELGHFIDEKYAISDRLSMQIIEEMTEVQDLENSIIWSQLEEFLLGTDDQKGFWRQFLKKRVSSTTKEVQQYLKAWISEYFADLFCSQYTGKCTQNYLSYHTLPLQQEMMSSDNQDHSCAVRVDTTFMMFDDHPPTSLRFKLIDDFLREEINKETTDNLFLKKIREAVQFSTESNIHEERFLCLRYKNPDPDCIAFQYLLPVEIKSPQELHGIFECAWNFWEKPKSEMFCDIDPKNKTTELAYTVINNLTEKSISNYITIEQWSRITKQKTANLYIIPSDHSTRPITPGYLTKTALHKLVTEEDLKSSMRILPLLDNEQIGDMHIDFRLGYDFLVSEPNRQPYIETGYNASKGSMSMDAEVFYKTTRRKLGEKFILHPHQTVLAISIEYLKLPKDCMMQLYMRSSYSRLGIVISSVINPGYCGCLSFELTNNNNNPINLTVGSRLIKGVIYKSHELVKHYNGELNYICLVRPVPPNFSKDSDLKYLNDLEQGNSDN